MKRKFLIRTLFISLSAMVLFGVFAVFLVYYRIESMLKDDLVRLSEIILDEALRDEASLAEIASYKSSSDTAFRITFINSEGVVVADSFERDEFEKHLDRPEVKSALEGNPMFSKRYSSTLGKTMIYYAVAFNSSLDEVYILRVAIESSAALSSTFSVLPILLAVSILLTVAIIFLNSKYNNASIQPIVELKHQLQTINVLEDLIWHANARPNHIHIVIIAYCTRIVMLNFGQLN